MVNINKLRNEILNDTIINLPFLNKITKTLKKDPNMLKYLQEEEVEAVKQAIEEIKRGEKPNKIGLDYIKEIKDTEQSYLLDRLDYLEILKRKSKTENIRFRLQLKAYYNSYFLKELFRPEKNKSTMKLCLDIIEYIYNFYDTRRGLPLKLFIMQTIFKLDYLMTKFEKFIYKFFRKWWNKYYLILLDYYVPFYDFDYRELLYSALAIQVHIYNIPLNKLMFPGVFKCIRFKNIYEKPILVGYESAAYIGAHYPFRILYLVLIKGAKDILTPVKKFNFLKMRYETVIETTQYEDESEENYFFIMRSQCCELTLTAYWDLSVQHNKSLETPDTRGIIFLDVPTIISDSDAQIIFGDLFGEKVIFSQTLTDERAELFDQIDRCVFTIFVIEDEFRFPKKEYMRTLELHFETYPDPKLLCVCTEKFNFQSYCI